QHAERLIASSIGAASSRLVMSLLLRKRTVSAKAALKLLDYSHAALHFNREILQTALNHVRQGIAVFDTDLQLICWNRQFAEILGLPLNLVQIGIPLREMLEFMEANRSAGLDDSDSFLEMRRAALEMRLAAYTAEGEPYLERLPDRHMVIEVRSNRMPGSGLVITFSDVTPSFEAAEALERANATLEKRVRDRTEELTRLNSELALAKSAAEDANNSKTRFLAAASHDILQPLNAARLYDTGVGIPALKRGEIFKEFHRLEQGARIARGLGLGLSIVERLARVLNHGIAIDSVASGGSVFSVTVPVAAAINHTAAVISTTP